MKELDAISKKCKDKGFKNVAEFVKVMEELFDQTSVDNREFWEDIDFERSSGVSQGCDSHRDTETRPSSD